MMPEKWQAFRADVPGVLVDRPNRFLVRVDVGGQVVEAHCPNPGRLSELLLPGVAVSLERASEGRKTPYTLVAVDHPSGATVPMASVRSNQAVGSLILPRWFPQATKIQAEAVWGSSRFDWLVEEKGKTHLIEVKACSEVEFGTALFPDAPSMRAKKHLEELAGSADQGFVPHVIFTVVHGQPRFWAPNLHTDPDFARTLRDLSPRLQLHAVVFQTQPDGETRLVNDHLPVVLPPDVPDSGVCLFVDLVPKPQVRAEFWAQGLDKRVGQGPARRTFALRGQTSLEPWQPWVEKNFDRNPLHERAFVDAVMRARHGGLGEPD